MNISKRFIERPIATAMLMVAILLFGLVSYPQLPVSALPRVDYPTIQVSASYPGASPDTMAALLAAPLERQFAQIPGVTQLTSSSARGSTQVTLQFELGRNLDGAAQDVQTAINAAGGQLPRDLPAPPYYRKVNPSDTPIIILALTSDSLPMTAVDDAADTIMGQQIAQISGVGQVRIGGEQKPAVRIEVNPDKLSALGLSFEDVRNALSTASVERPKGTLLDSHQTYSIDANDQLVKAEAYNDVIIATNNGAPVRVRDIGEAISGPENTLQAAWFNHQQAVLIIIMRQPEADVIATVDRIRAALPAIEHSLPAGIQVHDVLDRTQTIRASVEEVRMTLLLSIALVVAVVFVFLRSIWGTIIPSVVVPLAIIGTFAIMLLLNYSIDNLSLMGLTIAVGFVVDDAIVMVENIERHMGEGLSAYEAAVKGAGEIGFTIVSISISLIAVFIPLFFMSGYVGELFREFAVVVAVAVVMSLCVSLTLTPMMSARLLAHEKKSHGRLYMALERFFDWLVERYSTSLKWVLRHQSLALLVLAATVALSVALFIILPKGFFPEQDTGIMGVTVQGAPEISYADMSAKHGQAVDIIAADPAVQAIGSFVGASGSSGSLNKGNMFVALKPENQRHISMTKVIDRLRPKLNSIPGTNVYLRSNQDINVGGRISSALYQYTVSDTSQDELDSWMPKIVAKIRTLPGVSDVTTDQDLPMPQISLVVNRDAASRLGVSPSAIDDILDDAFGQRQIATIFSSINQYHVVLEADSRVPIGPNIMSHIYVKSETGSLVPLSAVTTDERTTSPQTINHQGSFPATTVSFNLVNGTSLGTAVDEIEQAMTELGAPETIHGGFQGTAQVFQSSLKSTPYLIGAALIAIYVILSMLYESLLHPLTILSTLPSAGVGALMTLLIAGQEFTVMALIGIILLIGIVKKNGIMLVDFALQAERGHGATPEDAIYDACLKRFRPIMMTTSAALLTGVPLAIGFGTGSELRQPLGLAIVGGLVFSQAITLYTTPVVYLALERARARVLGAWHRRFPGKKKSETAHGHGHGPELEPEPAE